MQKFETAISGLFVLELDIFDDQRGWFKENWNHRRMTEMGLGWFRPIQQNVSYNAKRGVTRGMHAEPWDKLVSVTTGSVHGAWVDLRENSPTFGKTFQHHIDPKTAVFIPRGVANGFQALENGTTYIYLVNGTWSPNGQYAFTNLDQITWPIKPTVVSEKDLKHPPLAMVDPVPPKKTLVTGANGQLGRAFQKLYPEFDYFDSSEFNLTSIPELAWSNYGHIINCAAYTNVDQAEAEPAKAWAVNAQAVEDLSRIANEYGITLVHFSSDYVFDGTVLDGYTENHPVSPLNTYGASKAAGELATKLCERHYLIRTSWVVGEGRNFITTMRSLGLDGVSPTVVDDQFGRPTFTDDLAEFAVHLLLSDAEYGTYNFSNSGTVVSWFDLAQTTYDLLGLDPSLVQPISTESYYSSRASAVRPRNSVLRLNKASQTGFRIGPWEEKLRKYLASEGEEG